MIVKIAPIIWYNLLWIKSYERNNVKIKFSFKSLVFILIGPSKKVFIAINTLKYPYFDDPFPGISPKNHKKIF